MTADHAVADAALRVAFDTEWARVVAAVMASTRDWDLSEESAQEAFARAARRWPEDGVPDRPGGWLTIVAKRHAMDQLRRRRTSGRSRRSRPRSLRSLPWSLPDVDVARVDDDLLALVICCCHPALPVEGRVALTLRTVLGLPVSAIARGLGVAEPTVSQRITRAKHHRVGRHRAADAPAPSCPTGSVTSSPWPTSCSPRGTP